MAINGYRTIPTDGAGELFSWPGCVVLVNQGWVDGPAFAERVAATDHEDAALAFRDLAGWLLARSGDQVADFAAVLQTGSSLLCMAAGAAEVALDDGRRVAADVSGMWAQLVLPNRPSQIQLGVSAGAAPDRIDLEHGVVPATGAILIPRGDGPTVDVAGESASQAGETDAGNANRPAEPGDGESASVTSSATAPEGGVSRPQAGGAPSVAEEAPIDEPNPTLAVASPVPAPGNLSEPSSGMSGGVAEVDLAAMPAPDADVTGDPRGSPRASTGTDTERGRHQLPFDGELDEGQPTDADGLIGIVSEEPESSGGSGSAAVESARPGHPLDGPEPTGEHRAASSFGEETASVVDEPSNAPPEPAAAPAAGEATGLVPIVTTPDVPGSGMPSSMPAEPEVAPSAGDRSPRGAAALNNEADWPPPPAWAAGGARDDAPEDVEQPDDPESAGDSDASDAWEDDSWSTGAGAFDGVGGADADLVTSSEDSGDDSSDASGDDTNEREWDADGGDDDQSIPLLLFDDGVAVELPGDVLIGRRPDPGVRDDPTRLHTLTMTDDSQAVSRNHVELRRRDDEVSIVDCGSANGTFVEATPGELTRLDAESPHMLRDGERVVFGKRWFEYRAPRGANGAD